MDLEIRHLRLVRALAQYGSLTRASGELHLSQSALSHQLVGLERRLGLALFHRHGRRMIPTAAGLRLIDTANRTLAAVQRAEDDLRRWAAGKRGLLRLSTECYTTYAWLPRVLTNFRRQFPDIEVQIVAEATRDPLRALLAGRLDLAIVACVQPHARLSMRPLFTDDMLVIVPANHRLAERSYVRAEDFTSEHLILYTTRLADSLVFQQVLVPAGVTPRQISMIQLTEGIIEMVRAGAGITVLARWAVAPYLRDGSLRGVKLTRNGYSRQWSAVMLDQEPVPAYINGFIDQFATYAPGLVAA